MPIGTITNTWRWDAFFALASVTVWCVTAGSWWLLSEGMAPLLLIPIWLLPCAMACALSAWGIVVRLVTGGWPRQWRQSARSAWSSLWTSAHDQGGPRCP